MLKCKYEHCQYPNCNGEDCGVSVENLLVYMCAEAAQLREIPHKMCRAALNSTVSNLRSTLANFLPESYTPECPYGYRNCISDPAYIHRWHTDWWIELGRPTVCDCGAKYREECPYYDDEDK